ncbi:hypothetical protein CS063_04135 [Sporanaerobium hydrogeniformans]|uniref:Uncharacterized protein n=1 Tax=Sporanaerobium hydrogeniformans TaxID=3072179 RepID=A0AC61DEZ4_9FIRM|nr:flagellar biosynthetic protein FliO [Sporanaerobium hydrogeniformans]PHV71754.1 hypothetical protein CS063_04135 [Sporanaerobium hydrogeniformans]
MEIKDFFEILLLLIVFGGVLFLTYFVTRKMAMINKKMHFNKNMQIIEVLQLGQAHYLYIVKIGKEYHLMSCGKEGIRYCAKLDGVELEINIPQEKSFQEHLIAFAKDWQVKKHEK